MNASNLVKLATVISLVSFNLAHADPCQTAMNKMTAITSLNEACTTVARFEYQTGDFKKFQIICGSLKPTYGLSDRNASGSLFVYIG